MPRNCLALFATFAALFATSAMAADTEAPAEAFVRSKISAGLAILNDNSLTKDQKSAQFHDFLLSLTNLNAIVDYTLGPAKNAAAPADLAEFENAFREYSIALYEIELSRYADRTLRVTGAMPLNSTTTIVKTVLAKDTRTPRAPTELDFRIFGTPGNFTVGDVSVMGIDLAITAQDQVQTFLWQHHNDIKALSANFKQRTEKMRAGS